MGFEQLPMAENKDWDLNSYPWQRIKNGIRTVSHGREKRLGLGQLHMAEKKEWDKYRNRSFEQD